jgi:hypothetical protein
MLHDLKTKREFRVDVRGNEVAVRTADKPSPATAATWQREPDLIMEALLREYLTGPLHTN